MTSRSPMPQIRQHLDLRIQFSLIWMWLPYGIQRSHVFRTHQPPRIMVACGFVKASDLPNRRFRFGLYPTDVAGGFAAGPPLTPPSFPAATRFVPLAGIASVDTTSGGVNVVVFTICTRLSLRTGSGDLYARGLR